MKTTRRTGDHDVPRLQCAPRASEPVPGDRRLVATTSNGNRSTESWQETAHPAAATAGSPTDSAHLHPPSGVATGHVTPLNRARHEPRFRRQHLIKAYQHNHDCNLVVVIDQIVPDTITLFAETLMELDTAKDLHLLLHTPDGDGEVAVRMARMAQEAGNRFVLLVPDTAKSAGTVLALAAHEIVMGSGVTRSASAGTSRSLWCGGCCGCGR